MFIQSNMSKIKQHTQSQAPTDVGQRRSEHKPVGEPRAHDLTRQNNVYFITYRS